MPLPVSTNAYQVRFVWENSTGPRPASHALNFKDTVGTQDAVDLGTDLVANLTANMWKLVSPNAGIKQIYVTPLDGISATYAVPFTVGLGPVSGSGTGDAIPQGASVVTVVSARRGKQWRNRTYVPFVGESEQNAGTLTSGDVTTAQTAWTTFFSAMTAADWAPAVISPAATGPVLNFEPATNYVVRPYLKTQRRRARR